MKEYGERLKKISPNLPNDPAVINLVNLVRELLEEIQRLHDEIASLKNQPPRPKITPSKLEKDPGELTTRKSNWTKSSKELVIDRTEKIELPPEQVPQDAKFKGYKEYIIQELIIRKEAVRYLLAQWEKADGHYICAKPPAGIEGHHFGPNLRKHIICQYHANRVTQNRIVDDLKDKGIKISEGQVNTILEEMAEILKAEKEALLAAGLTAGRAQVDDTGARHKKENGVATVICNDFFSYFKSTRSKSRINFLEIFCGSKIEYTITDEALDYIKGYDQPKLIMDKLYAMIDKGPKNK